MEELMARTEDLFMDYDVLEDIRCLEGKEIIVYGAGRYGSRASEMLLELGFPGHQFCDRDASRHGTDFMGKKIFSIREVEKKENLLFIVAIGDRDVQKAVGQTLACITGAKLLSFFALEKAWKYATGTSESLEIMMEKACVFCRRWGWITDQVRTMRNSPVLVYQSGKVGSSTVHYSLNQAGIRSVHAHHFISTDWFTGRMMSDVWENGFCESPFFESPEYKKRIKGEVKGRKIITMVRDPIAVDLSRAFQVFGAADVDWYLMEQMGQGYSFQQAIVKFMLRIQNHLFDWFDVELKELCGIDVFMYPFDREKGYAIIHENDVEVLLLKTEKLSGLAEVIGDFVGLPQFELVDDNVGAEKEYAHIYRKTKENLVLPKEYVDFYYEGNPRMNHFYSEAEREALKRKWRRD